MRTALVAGIGILILALGFSLPAVARAQTLPDTPAGRQAAAFLEALRSIDEDARRGFVEQRLAPTFRDQFPVEVHLEQLRMLAGELAGARIVGVQMPNPTAIRVALENARGERLRLAVEVEPEPPHRITMLGIDDTGGEEPVIRFGNLEELNRALERLTQEDRFSGVVLASRGGEVVFHEAYGLADRERKRPARRDTRFNIGSLNKSFTGVAILRLAQEGRLSLDDPIGKYLQGFPPEVANRVTIRQLLQHRSGMGDYLTHPEFRRDPKRFRTVDDLLELIRPAPLAFEPGTRQRYSNSGYVVLGAVIEALTGRPYHDVMHEWIFEPAGMTRTGPGGQEADPNTAIGYSRRLAGSRGELVSNEQVRGPGSPAGGGYSTAEDLLRFVRALLADRLLEPSYTDLSLRGYAPASGTEVRRGGQIGSGGGAPGLNAAYELDVATGDVVIVLANLDPPIAEQLASAISQQLPRR